MTQGCVNKSLENCHELIRHNCTSGSCLSQACGRWLQGSRWHHVGVASGFMPRHYLRQAEMLQIAGSAFWKSRVFKNVIWAVMTSCSVAVSEFCLSGSFEVPFLCAVTVHPCEQRVVPVTNRPRRILCSCWLWRTVFTFRKGFGMVPEVAGLGGRYYTGWEKIVPHVTRGAIL